MKILQIAFRAVPVVALLGIGIAVAEPRGLEAADTDGDGLVSLTEFEAAHAARVAERFARMDENGDGLLSADEMQREGRRGHHGQSRRHHPGPERMVEHLDADNSGSLSLAELEGRRFMPSAEEFYAADQDGNGELGAAELAELMKARHEQLRRNREEQR